MCQARRDLCHRGHPEVATSHSAVMQTLTACSKHALRNTCSAAVRCRLSSTLIASSDIHIAAPSTSGTTPPPLPWFVDPADATPKAGSSSHEQRQPQQQHQQLVPLQPIPTELDPQSPIRQLHARLSTSPFLEPGMLLVCRPIPTEAGPPLQLVAPKGRRKRGRTYGGEGMLTADTGIWQWNVIAQVRFLNVA